MSLISIAYQRNDFNQEPFQNVNPNRRLFIDDVAEQFVWWNDTLGVELFRIPSDVDATQLITVLDFDFVALNALPAVANPFVLVAGIIPANKRVLNAFLVMDVPFVNPSADDLNTVFFTPIAFTFTFNSFTPLPLPAGGVQQIGNQRIESAVAGIIKNPLAQDATVNFGFVGGAVNPQDFTAGRLRVIIQVSDYPL